MSIDINPEVTKEIESTEWGALCEEEVAKLNEPEKTESTTSTGERRKEPTTRTPQGGPSSFSDQTGVRASHVESTRESLLVELPVFVLFCLNRVTRLSGDIFFARNGLHWAECFEE
ncbi:hypothetical protein NDU88_002087 [Pleurodeles waltl]|uniref:Uncharacterized protein n=1 Tax=Pleurodeles waltl TaxID=8319 RepID=A0AAV7NED3_PLEWA|nr:hypothetical protein NDU88_002087 [Pleurodeles waltl]